jgi:hypothetical protein
MPLLTSRARFLAGGVLVGLAVVFLNGEAAAQQNASLPDLYRNGIGWYGVGDFIAVPGGARPVSSNPAYPYVPRLRRPPIRSSLWTDRNSHYAQYAPRSP